MGTLRSSVSLKILLHSVIYACLSVVQTRLVRHTHLTRVSRSDGVCRVDDTNLRLDEGGDGGKQELFVDVEGDSSGGDATASK